MLAVLPHPHIPPFEVLGLTVTPFSLLVGVAICVGMFVSQWRAARLGLDPRVIGVFVVWVVLWSFIGAHLFTALFYFPERLADDPLYLFAFWDGMSSFGGFLGGTGAALWYLNRRRRWTIRDGRLRRVAMRKLPAFPYVDAVGGYGLLYAWIVGRLACTIAFDHPGVATHFALGMPYPVALEPDLQALLPWFQQAIPDIDPALFAPPAAPIVRHNLGFYELLWALAVGVYFAWRGRRPAFSGWYITMLPILYVPFRFPLDFLRAYDERYLGLTAGQYAGIGIFVVAVALHRWRRRVGDIVVPDGQVHVLPDGTPAVLSDHPAAAGQ